MTLNKGLARAYEHILEIVLDGDHVNMLIQCYAADGAQCRRACTQGCEEYCSSPSTHIEPIDFCHAVAQINMDDALDYHANADSLHLRDGMPINVRWDGYSESWEWKGADARWRDEIEAAQMPAK